MQTFYNWIYRSIIIMTMPILNAQLLVDGFAAINYRVQRRKSLMRDGVCESVLELRLQFMQTTALAQRDVRNAYSNVTLTFKS